MALHCVVSDHCKDSVHVARDRLFIFTYSMKWAWMNIRTHFISNRRKMSIHTHFLSFSPPKLIYSPVWFVCRIKWWIIALWLVRSPVNQALCDGSVLFCLCSSCCYGYFGSLVRYFYAKRSIDRSQRAWLTGELINQNAEIMCRRCYPPSCPTATTGLHRNTC